MDAVAAEDGTIRAGTGTTYDAVSARHGDDAGAAQPGPARHRQAHSGLAPGAVLLGGSGDTLQDPGWAGGVDDGGLPLGEYVGQDGQHGPRRSERPVVGEDGDR